MSAMPALIAVTVVTGTEGPWIQRKVTGFGIEGEVDASGKQIYYESIDVMRQFHPEVVARWGVK